MTASRMLRTLSNRPGNIFRDIGLLSSVCSYSRAARLSRRRDQVAVAYNNLSHRPCTAILRRELALLDGSLNIKVAPFFERHGNMRQIAVEAQVVPIRVFLRLLITVLEAVGLAQTRIGNWCP